MPHDRGGLIGGESTEAGEPDERLRQLIQLYKIKTCLSLLAEHLGREKSQRRLLAVLHEDCTPRLGMHARLWLDMTDDDAIETDIRRLVYEL
jgi:hypothetical protein